MSSDYIKIEIKTMNTTLSEAIEYLRKTDYKRYAELLDIRTKDPYKFKVSIDILNEEIEEKKTTDLSKINEVNFLDELNVDLKKDGIRYVDNFFNWEEVKKLSALNFKENETLIPFIGNGTTLVGKLTNEIQPFKQEVELVYIEEMVDKDDREAQLATLNPILKHKKDRNFSSGNGEIRSNPTSRLLVVTNPVWGTATNGRH